MSKGRGHMELKGAKVFASCLMSVGEFGIKEG